MDREQRYAEKLRRDIERDARRCAKKQRPRDPMRGAMFGVLIIGIGLLLLLNNLGIVHMRDVWDFAPLLVIFVGVVRLVEARGQTMGSVMGGVIVGVGFLWLANTMGWFHVDGAVVGPAILMLFGALFLVRALERQRTDAVDGSGATGANTLSEWVLFGGVKRTVAAMDFRGGSLFAMFGGIEIDLRQAGIGDPEVHIDANAMFGGIELKVPTSWDVVVRGQGIFGGYEDKSMLSSTAEHPRSRLVVTGVAMFGGVSVQN